MSDFSSSLLKGRPLWISRASLPMQVINVVVVILRKPSIRLTTAYCEKKLQLYGLDPHAVQWFKSYLSNRFQSTYVNGTLSDYLPVSYGVPQGSVLGPLLFLIYINDLQECELSSSALMYADDTSLTLSAYDPATLEEKLNKDLDEVQKWLKSNKLTLNVKKTKYMISGSHYRLRHINGDLNVTVNSQRLTRVTNYRYLGIEVDEALLWQSHVDTICKKVSAGIAALKCIRFLVPRQTLLKMYDALVAPCLIIAPKSEDVWEKACVTDSRDCKIGLGEL